MTQTANDVLKKAGTPGHTFLRSEERQDLERDLVSETERIKHAQYFGVTSTNIGESFANKRRIQERINREVVPDLDGESKDIIAKEIEVIEGKIRHGMPTREAQRRNEVGAVHHHITWENHNKSRIIKWKNLKKVLENDSDDPDLCNVERLRPTVITTGGTSTFKADAQISGHVALSESAKENVPGFMDKVPEGSGLGQIIAADKVEESTVGMDQITRTTATGRDVKQPAFEARECSCGCAKVFIPKIAKAKFATSACRSRFYSKQQAEKKRLAKQEAKEAMEV
jgi:hypothetical protein